MYPDLLKMNTLIREIQVKHCSNKPGSNEKKHPTLPLSFSLI